MIDHKRLGVMMTENQIKAYFRQCGFQAISYSSDDKKATIRVLKDYSKSFNIDFDGIVELEVIIFFEMTSNLWLGTYPKFKEITNQIPKKSYNHIYNSGNICYAPTQRPLNEKWKLPNFISSVDAMINNYFTTEYIGTGTLFELEHGDLGLKQYNIISRIRNQKKSS